jgi:hypothetical protein
MGGGGERKSEEQRRANVACVGTSWGEVDAGTARGELDLYSGSCCGGSERSRSTKIKLGDDKLEKKDKRLCTVRYELGVGAGGLPPGQAATNNQEEEDEVGLCAHFMIKQLFKLLGRNRPKR